MLALTLTVATIVLLLVLYGAASVLLARAVVYPQRARPTDIVAATPDGQVTLSLNALTRFDGILGLLYDDESRLAVLQPGADVDEVQGRVTRKLAAPARVQAGAVGRASGNIFTASDATDRPPADVEIQTNRGTQPAWLFAGNGEDASVWVIHVHGMLAGRDSALRSVNAVTNTGYTSLVVSYRGDGEAEAEKRMPSALGQVEWEDLDAAVAFARAGGAARIIVMGWSLGATIALEQVRRGPQREAVDALVLVSPVINWAATIHYGMARQRVPRWLASSAIAVLTSNVGARLLGLPHALELPAAIPTAPRPTLVIHSTGDLTTPFAASQAYAESSPLATLNEFPSSPHATEWNTAPERFAEVASSWIIANLRQEGPGTLL
jgi:hypothetical protein